MGRYCVGPARIARGRFVALQERRTERVRSTVIQGIASPARDAISAVPNPPAHLGEAAAHYWRMLAEALGADGWHESLRVHMIAAARASAGIDEWVKERIGSDALCAIEEPLDAYSRLLEEQGAALEALGVCGGEGAVKH